MGSYNIHKTSLYRNRGLFTNGSKKMQKPVQSVIHKRLFLKVSEEESIDIIVINVLVGLVQKEDLKTYKRLSSKSMYIKDKY